MRLGELSRGLAHVACAAAATAGMGVAQCWQWSDGFEADVTGSVQVIEYFDGGAGPALYVAGGVKTAGATPVRSIARWDGSEWSDVGNGVNGWIYTGTTFDDGSGSALIIGGNFTEAGGVRCGGFARWDGYKWSPMGAGFTGETRALAVFDDGSGHGPQLYAAGAFQSPVFPYAHHYVLRWDGERWEPIASRPTINATVNELAVYDDGSGPALYAAGGFLLSSGGLTRGIARWDGTEWSAVGGGVDTSGSLFDLHVFDDGDGPALFLGGDFYGVGGVGAKSIAKWNGSRWSVLGDNQHHQSYIRSMAVFDDGSGPALFTAATSGKAAGRWDGVAWTEPEISEGRPYTLATFPFAPRVLFMGADTLCLGGDCASGFFGWDGEALQRFGDGQGFRYGTSYVEALGEADDRRLYVGGTIAGNVQTGGVALWNGFRWRSLGRCPVRQIQDFALFDDGTGNGDELHAAGYAGWPLAKWTGARWVEADLGELLPGQAASLAVFDDGTGPTLYAAGSITLSNDPWFSSSLVRWDGAGWRAVPGAPKGFIRAMILDEGSPGRPALYFAGTFAEAGGVPAKRVARWDGATWSPLGAGLEDEHLQDLCLFDSGNGSELYAAGGWPEQTDQHVLSRWDGTAWHPVFTSTEPFDAIRSLHVFDDGSGPALIAAGQFKTIEGVAANSIARWNGTTWSPLGRGLPGIVLSLGTYQNDLYAAGHIDTAGKHLSSNFARWFDACK